MIAYRACATVNSSFLRPVSITLDAFKNKVWKARCLMRLHKCEETIPVENCYCGLYSVPTVSFYHNGNRLEILKPSHLRILLPERMSYVIVVVECLGKTIKHEVFNMHEAQKDEIEAEECVYRSAKQIPQKIYIPSGLDVDIEELSRRYDCEAATICKGQRIDLG